MSGIAGIVYFDDQQVNSVTLGDMLNTLRHRGRDKQGLWYDNNVGLIHCLHITTPEAANENSPEHTNNQDLVLTSDARLDNRNELQALLNLNNYSNNVFTDSQIILAAYEKWGVNCPEYLIGDFAFAIWDKRQQQLFCVRDRFGVKPFYYTKSKNRFIFASELKAIFTLPDILCELNDLKVADYLTGTFTNKTGTFFKEILRLPPAHTITVTTSDLSLKRYWRLNPEYELRLNSNEEYAEAYLEVLSTAVQTHLRSSSPEIGSLLSGGLDSSSVVCVARDILRSQKPEAALHTFSSIFDKVTEADERPYITAVIDQGDINAHFTHGDQISPLYKLDQIHWHQDEAFYAFNLFLYLQNLEVAQRQGVTVLLDGMYGDSTIPYGYAYLTELSYNWQWMNLGQEMWPLSKRHNYQFWGAFGRNIWRYGVKTRIPGWAKKIKSNITQKQTKPPFDAILKPDFVEHVVNNYDMSSTESYNLENVPLTRKLQFFDLESGLTPFNLEVANKCTAAYGIEPRYPFLDKRVVEFGLALPASQKLQAGWGRFIVRQAIKSLPDKVRWRVGKGNIAPNFRHNLLLFEKKRIEEVIIENPDVLEPYINIPQLRGAYRHFQEKGKDAHSDAVQAVWRAVTLALWLRSLNFQVTR